MKFFKSKVFIVLATVTVIIVTLMILSAAFNMSSNPVSGAVGVVTAPLQRGVTGIGNGIGTFLSTAIEMGQYKHLYEDSQNKISELEDSVREIDSLRNENDRLRALLEFKQRETSRQMVAAQVAGKNPDNWYSEILLSKGTTSGINIDNVVVTDKGLVGCVTEVGPTWSKVTTVLDVSASVGCMLSRSGDTAMAEGDAELAQNGECSMNYISKDATVVVGDSVETSGIGSVYPAGIFIGKISGITPDLQGLYNKATIKTAVDFNALKEVMVIIG